MGLDTTHNAWHGPYSSFNQWRERIAQLAGFPPLVLMDGFYNTSPPFNPFFGISVGHDNYGMLARVTKQLPIKWDAFEGHPLTCLLNHSDCDGDLAPSKCGKIAKALEKLLPMMDGETDVRWKAKTEQFIDGCKLAHSRKEKMEFK